MFTSFREKQEQYTPPPPPERSSNGTGHIIFLEEGDILPPHVSTIPQVIIPEVIIGTQTWALKNLDVAFYNNGDPIPEVQDPTAWAALTTGAWCSYDNNPANDAIYGKLYNWFAVNDPRGLAFAGFHIPSDSEWTTLSTSLGGTSVAGGAMKEAGLLHWQSPNTGANNSSGFTGLPGGFRFNFGTFITIGYNGCWWSSTENGTTDAWNRSLVFNTSNVDRGFTNKKLGFSVRCLKD